MKISLRPMWLMATVLACASVRADPQVLDDFEDGDLVSALGTTWSPLEFAGGRCMRWESQPLDDVTGLGKRLHLDIDLPPVGEGLHYLPLAGVVLPIPAGALAERADLDGIAFTVAGTSRATWLLYAIDGSGQPRHGATLPVRERPRRIIVRWKELTPRPDDEDQGPVELAHVTGLAWAVIAPLGDAGCVVLDDVALVATEESLKGEADVPVTGPYPGHPPRSSSLIGTQGRLAPWPQKTDLSDEVVVPLLPDQDCLVVEATIEGTGPHRFVLDSGAGMAMLPSALATSLDLAECEPAKVTAIDGTTETRRTSRVKEIRIGSAAFRDVPVGLVDGPLLELLDGTGTIGVLPLTLFHDLLVTIDGPDSELRLARGSLEPGPATARLRIRRGRWVPEVRIRLDRRRAWATLDTGNVSHGLLLPLKLSESLMASGAAPVRQWGVGVAGYHETQLAPIAGSVRFAGITLAEPWAAFGSGSPNIGNPVLRQLVSTWDVRNRLVQVEPVARAVVVPAPGPTTGLFAPWRCGARTVHAVAPDSPAASAGFRVGDVLLAVDGVPSQDGRWPRATAGVVQRYAVLRDGERIELALTPTRPSR